MARRYEVSGSRSFHGHEPGETFEADLSEAKEARAIARGSITVAGRQAAPKSEPVKPPEPEPTPETVEEAPSQWGDSTPGQPADETEE